MKTGILIAGMCVCGLLALAKILGLLFVDFSVKQLIYALALVSVAIGMLTASRTNPNA